MSKLEIIKIPYDSPEWLKYRNTGIGGSDAGSIIGQNPYKTNIQLYKEKIGEVIPEDISNKPSVKFGKEAEDSLFNLFKLDYPEYNAQLVKDVVYRRDFAFASLDGILEKDGKKGIFEAKTATIQTNNMYSEWRQQVPSHYFWQIIHYLMVTGFDFAILKARIKKPFNDIVEIKHYFFDRKDVEDDIVQLYAKEKEFWYEHVVPRVPMARVFKDFNKF